MNENSVITRLRRLGIVGLAIALLVQLALIVSAAAPANAVPPCDPDCGGPGPIITYHSTLTVTPPALGTVIGRNTDTNTVVIQCTSPGPCAHTDLQGSDSGRPEDGWPTYAFTYSGPPGYGVTWADACSGTGACSVTNDQPNSSLTATSHDVQAPTVSISAPSRVGPDTAIVANADDNTGTITSYQWFLCAQDGNGCAGPIDTRNVFEIRDVFSPSAGMHQVKVIVRDLSGNEAQATIVVDVVLGFGMSWHVLPPYTEAPVLTFQSNEEAHVVTRRCRSYLTGTTPGSWDACTTPTSYAPALAGGHWTLQAEEIDDLGLSGDVFDSTIVDKSPPAVAFTDGPVEGGTVSTGEVQVGFTATDDNLKSVTCSLDGAAPSACASPMTLLGYHDGQHTFTITATDELDHTVSAVRHFTVEVPPALDINEGPADGATVNTTSVTYLMSVTAGDVTSEMCGLDSHAAVPCTDSFTATGYADGAHTVVVTLGDAAGATTTVVRHFTAKVPTTLKPTASKVTITYGHRLRVSATVAPAGAAGTVRFRAGSNLALCAATVKAGVATCTTTLWTLTAGTRTVMASYSGRYSASSAHMTLVVRKAPTAVRVKMASTARHNRRLTVTATNLPAHATGWVTVNRAGHRLCAAKLSRGSAHCTFRASMRPGTYPVTVRYGGNRNYLASSKSVRLKVTR